MDRPPRLSWWVALRALVWSTLFAGTVAVWIPWRYFDVTLARMRPTGPIGVVGLGVLAAGVVLMLTCIGEFALRGRGTPFPADPPRELVVHGPYRVVRNPMYVGMVLTLLGELMLAFSWGLAGYLATWFTIIHLVVVLYEEPVLRGKFGDSYERYTREVGRWWPRRPPGRDGHNPSG